MPDAPYAPPSTDPGNDGSLSGLLRTFMTKMGQQTDDMLPARVIAYDRARNRATVQPMIMMGTTDGAKVSRAQIADVPVLSLGAGLALISVPLKPGDFGWIKASDRDVSLFMQGMSEEWPNTTRMHSFQDGLFIPDHLGGYTVDAEDADRLVITTPDGATRIALGAGRIRIVSDMAVDIEAPAIALTGTVTVEGTLTATSVATAGGIVLGTHRHTGVTTGVGTSGGPTP